jgi:hypothetical protein
VRASEALLRRRSGQQLLVEQLEAARHVCGGEPFEDELSSLLTEASPEIGASQQASNCRSESNGILGRNEQSGLTVTDDLGDAAYIRRDDCAAREERFENRKRESLKARR